MREERENATSTTRSGREPSQSFKVHLSERETFVSCSMVGAMRHGYNVVDSVYNAWRDK